MTQRLFVREEAKADIREARRWYAARAAGLGTEYTRAVRAMLAAVERNPRQFPIARGEVRRALLLRFPYALYFIPEREHIVVIGCLHGRRDPRLWQSRSLHRDAE